MDYPSTPSTPSDSDSDISNHQQHEQNQQPTTHTAGNTNSHQKIQQAQHGLGVDETPASSLAVDSHVSSSDVANSNSSQLQQQQRRVRRKLNPNNEGTNENSQKHATELDEHSRRKVHKQPNGSEMDHTSNLNHTATTISTPDELTKSIPGTSHKYSRVTKSHSSAAPILTAVSTIDASTNVGPPTNTLPLSSTFMSHQFSSTTHSSAVPYAINPLAFHPAAHPTAAPFPVIITHPITNATSFAPTTSLQQLTQTNAALPPLVPPSAIPPPIGPPGSKQRGSRRPSNPPLANEIHPNFGDILHQAVEDHRKEQQTAEARKKEHERVERETGLIAKSVLSYHVLNQLIVTESQLHNAALASSMANLHDAQKLHVSPSKNVDASSSEVVHDPSMPPLESGAEVRIKPEVGEPSHSSAATATTHHAPSETAAPSALGSGSTPDTANGHSVTKSRPERHSARHDQSLEEEEDGEDEADDGENENSPSSGSNDDSADSDYSASSNRQAARPCPLINHLMREPICTLEMQLHKKIFTPQQIKFLKLNQPQHLVPVKPFNTTGNGDKETSEEDLLTISIRIMGTFPPKETYFVAKDVCPMVRTNVAKTIQKYDDTEKARVPVLCMRANGSVSTHVLSVLTTKGLRKLLNSSRTPLAPQLLKRILAHMDELYEAGHQAYDQHMKRKQQLEASDARAIETKPEKKPRAEGRTKLPKTQRAAQNQLGEPQVKLQPVDGSVPIVGDGDGDERYFAIRRRVLDEQMQQHQHMVELEKRRYVEWQQYAQHIQNIQEVQKLQSIPPGYPLTAPSPFATYSQAYSTMPEYAAYVAATQTPTAYPTTATSSISMSVATPPSFPLSTTTASSSAVAYPQSPYLYYQQVNPPQSSLPPAASQLYNMQPSNTSVYLPAVYPQAYYSTPPVPTNPTSSYPSAYYYPVQ